MQATQHPITVIDASIYSVGSEVAYAMTYSDGTKVRAVEAPGRIFRKEYLKDGAWVVSGKPYVGASNRKRMAERMKEEVKAFLAS